MKKEWKMPELEVLDVSMTMKVMVKAITMVTIMAIITMVTPLVMATMLVLAWVLATVMATVITGKINPTFWIVDRGEESLSKNDSIGRLSVSVRE